MTNHIMDIELFIKTLLKTINRLEQLRTLHNIDDNDELVAYCNGQLKAYNDVVIELSRYDCTQEGEL